MPVSEFYDFMLYDQVEPLGGRRGDIQAGIIAATVANCNRSEKTKPFTPEDFIPSWEAKLVQPQSADKQLAIMKIVQQIQNAKVNG